MKIKQVIDLNIPGKSSIKFFTVTAIFAHPKISNCFNVFVEEQRDPFLLHETGLTEFDRNWRRFIKTDREVDFSTSSPFHMEDLRQ